MSQKTETTNQEIDALIAMIKKSNNYDSGEKYDAIELLEKSRPKKEEVVPATKEEIDAVFGNLFPEIPGA